MWYSKYVGIPYKEKGRDIEGTDCWGLARLIYDEQYSIKLPSFSTEYELSDTERIDELLAQYKEGWEKLGTPEEGCIVLFRVLGNVSHVGIMINDYQFLHNMGKTSTTLANINAIRWKDRVDGFYKYNSEASAKSLEQLPPPLKTKKLEYTACVGKNLGEILKLVTDTNNIKIDDKTQVAIFINGEQLNVIDNSNFIPKEDDVVSFRVLVGQDALKLIATIALVAFVPYLATQLLTVTGIGVTSVGVAASGFTFSATAVFAAQAVVSMVGMALIGAIFPVRPPDMPEAYAGQGITDAGSSNPQLMLTGSRNEARIYQSIPVILGQYKVIAPVAAQNFVYMDYDITYLRMLLTWGYGPVEVSEIQIGATPLANYDSYTMYTYQGEGAPVVNTLSTVLSIYGADVYQLAPNLPLVYTNSTNDYIYRTIPNKCTSIRVDIHFPNGLRGIYREGAVGVPYVASHGPIPAVYGPDTGSDVWPQPLIEIIPAQPAVVGNEALAEIQPGTTLPVQFLGIVEIMPLNDSLDEIGSWTTVQNIDLGLAGWNNYQRKDAFTHSVSTSVSYGYYKVRVRRLNSAETDRSDLRGKPVFYHNATLSLITAVDNTVAPVSFPTGTSLAMSSLNIKATDQLNGSIEGINALVKSICLDYNIGTGTWISRTTSNPASLFRYMLQHPANSQAISSADAAAKLDLATLQYWHTYCVNNGFTYNAVIIEQRSILEILRDICAAGRASPIMVGDKWSVVIDEARTSAVQFFTPHNSWGFEGSKVLTTMPHALRATFVNASKEYQSEEVMIYNDGYSAANASVFEAISFPGVTNYSQVYKNARFHLAQVKLRPEIYSLNTDIEHLVCTRGDLVRVTHDVPMWGLATGRIRDYINSTTIVLDEEVALGVGVSYKIRIRLADGSNQLLGVSNVVVSGYYTTITLDSASTSTVCAPGNLFMLGASHNESVELIVLSIEPSSNLTAKLTLTDYSPDVYTSDTLLIPAFDTKITRPSIYARNYITSMPIVYSTSINSDESVMGISGNNYVYNLSIPFINPANLEVTATHVEARICLSWDLSPNWREYKLQPIGSGSFLFTDVIESSLYSIQVRYVGGNGFVGPWSPEVQHIIKGRSTKPFNVPHFSISGTVLSWDTVNVLDLAGYVIRFHYGNNTDWGSATPLHTGILTQSPYDIVNKPSGIVTIMIKAQDSIGLQSELTTNIFTDLGDALTNNIVETIDFKIQNWPGTITNASNVATVLEAVGATSFYAGDFTSFYGNGTEPFYEDVRYASMEYVTNEFYVDNSLPNISGVLDIEYEGEGLTVEYRLAGPLPFYSSNIFYGVGEDPFYGAAGAWTPCPAILPLTKDVYQLRVRILGGSVQPKLIQLKLLLDVDDVIEYVNDVTISSLGTNIPYIKPFNNIKNVQVTLQANASNAVTVEIDKTSPLAPVVKAYNSSHVAVSGATADFIIKGY